MADTYATPEKIKPALRGILDLSTAHMTSDDNVQLDLFAEYGKVGVPRIARHDYGYIVFVNSDPDSLAATLEGMRAASLSEAFIAIYQAAAQLGGEVMAINFDRDAEIIEGLATFAW